MKMGWGLGVLWGFEANKRGKRNKFDQNALYTCIKLSVNKLINNDHKINKTNKHIKHK